MSWTTAQMNRHPNPDPGALLGPELFVGDIVKITEMPTGEGMVALLRVDGVEGDGRAWGSAYLGNHIKRTALYVHWTWGDELVACGGHEDCRNHLDLGIVCAAQRNAEHLSAHRASAAKGEP